MGDAYVYAADVSLLAQPELYRRAYDRVSEKRRQKTDRYVFPKDRYLSLGAELLLMEGLARMGKSLPTSGTECEKNGKPYLPGMAYVHFNLSHSGTMALCALSSRDVGCDIEKIASPNMNVSRRFFHPEEALQMESCPEEERADTFFRLWTLKESYMKATGLGMGLSMHAFCVRIFPDRPPRVSGLMAEEGWQLYERAFPGYRAALCLRGMEDPGRVEWIQTDLAEILRDGDGI